MPQLQSIRRDEPGLATQDSLHLSRTQPLAGPYMIQTTDLLRASRVRMSIARLQRHHARARVLGVRTGERRPLSRGAVSILPSTTHLRTASSIRSSRNLEAQRVSPLRSAFPRNRRSREWAQVGSCGQQPNGIGTVRLSTITKICFDNAVCSTMTGRLLLIPLSGRSYVVGNMLLQGRAW